MPLYEYECDRCGHRFEAIQKFADPPLETCPTCSGPLRKLQSAPAFQFKGSGWYITDYARKAQGSAKAETPAQSASGDKDTATQADKGDSSKTDRTDKGDKTQPAKSSAVNA